MNFLQCPSTVEEIDKGCNHTVSSVYPTYSSVDEPQKYNLEQISQTPKIADDIGFLYVKQKNKNSKDLTILKVGVSTWYR